MNAIVVVFMPARDGQPPSEQTAARPVVDLLPASPSFPATPEPDQGTQPFWTWFIENPRRYGV
jgi:hypothetical protein